MIVALLVISVVINVALIYSSYVTVKKLEVYEDNISEAISKIGYFKLYGE